jgi:hypothetical protein
MAISNAPLIFRAKFYQHNNEKDKHKRHIQYIATRPGADRGELNEDLEPEEVLGGTHTEYISERPGSHGLFCYREIDDYKEIQNELAEQRLSWRYIVSLRMDDAEKISYDNRQVWEEMLKAQINTVGEKMGIERSNLRWAAAFHVHPQEINCHAHIVVWEKNQLRTTGKLSTKEMKEIKRTFANEIFREERLKQMQEKTLMRDYVREYAGGSIAKAKELVRELRQAQKEGKIELKAWGLHEKTSLSPELEKEEELAEKLYSLSKIMPGRGRAALKFMPENVKQEAREIADWILKQPHFRHEVERHGKAAENLASTYVKKPAKLAEAKNKAYNDLRDRVANIVVRAGADLNRIEKQEKREVNGTEYMQANRDTAEALRNIIQGLEHVKMQGEKPPTKEILVKTIAIATASILGGTIMFLVFLLLQA